MDEQLSIALRPKKFARIVGQDIAVRLFQQMVAKSYVSRCVVICGPTGVGKTSLARIWAALLNCDEPQDLEPCGQCYHCESVFKSESSVVLEIESAVHRKVEDMDEIRQVVNYAIPSGKRRVVIMDEFHTVSDTAQESLLHILESTSLDTTFVLTTTDPRKIKDAIWSRSFPIYLGSIEHAQRRDLVALYCKDYKVGADDKVVDLVAHAAYGMRSVWQLVDKLKIEFGDKPITYEKAQDVLGLIVGPRLESLIAAFKKSFVATLSAAKPFQEIGVEWLTFLDSLYRFAEDSLVLHESGELRESAGVSEKFLSSGTWTKTDCIKFFESRHELSRLDWKSGLPRVYALFAAMSTPAQATHVVYGGGGVGSGIAAKPSPKIVTPVEMLNADPVWAQIGRFLKKRVVEAA